MSAFPTDDFSQRLAALESRARVMTRETGRPVLASASIRVDAVDPIEILRRMSERLETGDVARLAAEPRMYWARPSNKFELAGFGAAATLRAGGADRFLNIERDWNALQAQAIADDPSSARPVLMGGFAFDADPPRSNRWKDFPAALLFVPRLQIAIEGDRCTVTINTVVGDETAGTMDFESLLRAVGTVWESHNDRVVASNEIVVETAISYADALPEARWRAIVDTAIGKIAEGCMEKVVIAREVRACAPEAIDVHDTLRELRATHTHASIFGLWRGGSAFVGASPERLVSLDGDNVRASSLAGSVRRGATEAEDVALAEELRASAKDRFEHEIVRRALSTALGSLCTDVEMESEPSVLSFPHIHHLHTDVRARLAQGGSLLQLVGRLHPTPAVGGEPRDTALAFLRDEEHLDRGWYAGPIGWIQGAKGEFAVALRSALIDGREASLFAGCGIVAASDSAKEFAESTLKLRPMQLALGQRRPSFIP